MMEVKAVMEVAVLEVTEVVVAVEMEMALVEIVIVVGGGGDEWT